MGKLNLSQVQLNGVEEILEKHKGEESKGIKAYFKLDDSGIVELEKVRYLINTIVKSPYCSIYQHIYTF